MPHSRDGSDARYFAILDVAADAIISMDAQQRMTEFNQGAEAIFGWRAEEVLGQPLDILLPERFRDLHRQHVSNFLGTPDKARRMGERLPVWGRRRDGSEFPAAASISKLAIDGQLVLTVILRDVTDMQQANTAIGQLNRELAQRAAELSHANEELNRMAEMQRAILDFAGYGIGATELDGTMLSFNPAAEALLGYSAAEIIGRQTPQLWHDADEIRQRAAELSRELGREVSAGFEVFTVKAREQIRDDHEWTFIRKDGTRLPAQLNITALRDAQGTVTGYLGIFADISERKRHEEAIRALNRDLQHRAAQLEALNRELEAFSYSVSHDLRTPLRSIDGFSQVLLEDYADQLDAPGRDYLGRVRAASQRMAQLIDDLLNLSRLTRGVMRDERVDLSALAHEVADELRRSQPERQVEFLIEDGILVRGDSRLLRILLDNLLGNAWKYTSKHPHATIEFAAETRSGDRIACFVRDDGAGFDPAYADKLFGAFQRLHARAEFPGSGIGLVTAQRIVHRHGGDIAAEGAVERGATFRFSLPAAAVPEPGSGPG